MNKNIFKFAFVAITAGVLAVSCAKEKDNDSAIQKPVMVSISADPYFTDASAEVKATLSQAVDVPVTVTLAPGTTLSQSYTTPIDAELISAGTITIPAGQTEATATVTVNNAELQKGKYEAEIVAVSAKGANMSSNNAANILLLQGVSTVGISYSTNFDASGEATFTVLLDMYSEEDVTVSISQCEFSIAGYTNVPSMAFKFDKEVVIKAGETEATGKVSIDLDALYDTGRYVGGLQIKSISSKTPEKFEISELNYYSGAAYNFVAPKKNKTWTIEYLGTQVVSDTPREVFFVSGVGGYLDYMLSDGDQEEVNSFIYPEIIVEENDYIASYMKAGYKLNEICASDLDKGYAFVTAKKRAPGTYKIWIVAVSDAGVCTGEYSTLEFTVEADPEPTDAYKAWIGQWTLGSTADDEEPLVISISQNVVNESYYVDGLEGLDTVKDAMSANAIFEADGSISIYAQVVGTWTHPSMGKATDILAGQIVSQGKEYYVMDDSAPVATGVIGANGVATLSGGTFTDDDGSVYGITGLKYYVVFDSGTYSYTSGNTPLPNTLIPVVPNEAEEGIKNVPVQIPYRPIAEHTQVLGARSDAILLK